MSELREIFESGTGKFVSIGDDNSITFKIQEGPIKEVGENGCQVDELVFATKFIIQSFQDRFPCRENALAITKLDEALLWLMARKDDRMKRGVEGFNQE